MNAFFDLMVQDPNKEQFLHPEMREQMTVTIRNTFHTRAISGSPSWKWTGPKRLLAELDYKNKLWGYNSAWGATHGAFAGLGAAGTSIQWCCEHERSEFDFMRGDEEYKYRFGGVN